MDISPIFADIVPDRARTSVYALDQSFESILLLHLQLGFWLGMFMDISPCLKGQLNLKRL